MEQQTKDVVSREKASHPVGTTVRVTDFLKNVPVRKQTALKTIAKSLAKLKKLVQIYSLARPSVRFSIKVLKAKNDKDNWTYGPRPNAGFVDAALKVFGKEVTGECVHKKFPVVDDGGASRESLTLEEGATSSLEGNLEYHFEAFLPKPDAGMSISILPLRRLLNTNCGRLS